MGTVNIFKCLNCGCKLERDLQICPECGSKVERDRIHAQIKKNAIEAARAQLLEANKRADFKAEKELREKLKFLGEESVQQIDSPVHQLKRRANQFLKSSIALGMAVDLFFVLVYFLKLVLTDMEPRMHRLDELIPTDFDFLFFAFGFIPTALALGWMYLKLLKDYHPHSHLIGGLVSLFHASFFGIICYESEDILAVVLLVIIPFIIFVVLMQQVFKGWAYHYLYVMPFSISLGLILSSKIYHLLHESYAMGFFLLTIFMTAVIQYGFLMLLINKNKSPILTLRIKSELKTTRLAPSTKINKKLIAIIAGSIIFITGIQLLQYYFYGRPFYSIYVERFLKSDKQGAEKSCEKYQEKGYSTSLESYYPFGKGSHDCWCVVITFRDGKMAKRIRSELETRLWRRLPVTLSNPRGSYYRSYVQTLDKSFKRCEDYLGIE